MAARRYKHDDIDKFHEFGLYVSDNTLYLGSHAYIDEDESGVDYLMSENLIKNLHILDYKKHDEGITIKMNNPGGCVYHGLAIYDAIRECQNHITIVCYGFCMSMGSLIFQAADTRVMSPNCRMMIHIGSDGFNGHAVDFQKAAQEGADIADIMKDIYLQKIKEVIPNFSKAKLSKMINNDKFMGAQEAIEMGLCDRILERKT